GLLVGLVLTLAAVTAYSLYVARQVAGLAALQRDLIDRNRRDSPQLLRIQNNLNQLGLAIRDMLEGGQPYPLAAWRSQFDRIRRALGDAVEGGDAIDGVESRGRERLRGSPEDFRSAAHRTFNRAERGREAEARAEVQLSLQARQAS